VAVAQVVEGDLAGAGGHGLHFPRRRLHRALGLIRDEAG
jgi:hypothetical protein